MVLSSQGLWKVDPGPCSAPPILRGIRKEKDPQPQQVPSMDPKVLKQMRKAEKAEREFRKKFKVGHASPDLKRQQWWGVQGTLTYPPLLPATLV